MRNVKHMAVLTTPLFFPPPFIHNAAAIITRRANGPRAHGSEQLSKSETSKGGGAKVRGKKAAISKLAVSPATLTFFGAKEAAGSISGTFYS